MSVVADIIKQTKERVKMTTMIKTYCQGCGKSCGEIALKDAPYTGEPTCWDCADEALYNLYKDTLSDML